MEITEKSLFIEQFGKVAACHVVLNKSTNNYSREVPCLFSLDSTHAKRPPSVGRTRRRAPSNPRLKQKGYFIREQRGSR
jgi:hypothetical protein